MYCAVCKCEFHGWTDTCPNCKNPLVEAAPPEMETLQKTIPYEDLLALVHQNGSQIKIELAATEVSTQKQREFPYFGFGFAWAKRMQGSFNNLPVDLFASEIGKDKKKSFPYFGYGFAWVKTLEGHVAGNRIVLTARRVERETKQAFPYRGYGFAWTQEMSGACGDLLQARLVITDVGRKEEYGFPYFGFGYAWENKGMLTLTA
jgi:hypothetical protein